MLVYLPDSVLVPITKGAGAVPAFDPKLPDEEDDEGE